MAECGHVRTDGSGSGLVHDHKRQQLVSDESKKKKSRTGMEGTVCSRASGPRGDSELCTLSVYGMREYFDKTCAATVEDECGCGDLSASVQYAGSLETALVSRVDELIKPAVVQPDLRRAEILVPDTIYDDKGWQAADLLSIAERAIRSKGKTISDESMLVSSMPELPEVSILTRVKALSDVFASALSSKRPDKKSKAALADAAAHVGNMQMLLNNEELSKETRAVVQDYVKEAQSFGIDISKDAQLLIRMDKPFLQLTDVFKDIEDAASPRREPDGTAQAETDVDRPARKQQLQLAPQVQAIISSMRESREGAIMQLQLAIPRALKTVVGEAQEIVRQLQDAKAVDEVETVLRSIKQKYGTLPEIARSARMLEAALDVSRHAPSRDQQVRVLKTLVDHVLHAPSFENCREHNAEYVAALETLSATLSVDPASAQGVVMFPETGLLKQQFADAGTAAENMLKSDACASCFREELVAIMKRCAFAQRHVRYAADRHFVAAKEELVNRAREIVHRGTEYIKHTDPDLLSEEAVQANRLFITSNLQKTAALHEVETARGVLQTVKHIYDLTFPEGEVGRQSLDAVRAAETEAYSAVHGKHGLIFSKLLEMLGSLAADIKALDDDQDTTCPKEQLRTSVSSHRIKIRAHLEEMRKAWTENLKRAQAEYESVRDKSVDHSKSDRVLLEHMKALNVEPEFFDPYNEDASALYDEAGRRMKAGFVHTMLKYADTPTTIPEQDQQRALEIISNRDYPSQRDVGARLRMIHDTDESRRKGNLRSAALYIRGAYEDVKAFMRAYKRFHIVNPTSTVTD